MKIVVRAPIFPTEDREKVKKAIQNIFPESDLETSEEEMVATTSSGEKFREIVKNHRIRDSARHVLRAGRRDGMTSFKINKQVAYVGKISFVEGNPALGSLDVSIYDDDIDAVIDDLAESTVEDER